MKKFTLISLAIATGLAISPVAFAQNYDFTFSADSGAITASGTLDAPGTFGVLEGNATSGNIVVAGDSNFTGTGTLYANPNVPGVQAVSPSGFFFYDDTLYPGQDPSIDNGGLLFIDNGNLLEINIYSNAPGVNYELYDNTGFNSGGAGTFTLTYVPEGGAALLYVLLAGGACFGAMFLSRNRFANLASA
jgi:hypothetical protein